MCQQLFLLTCIGQFFALVIVALILIEILKKIFWSFARFRKSFLWISEEKFPAITQRSKDGAITVHFSYNNKKYVLETDGKSKSLKKHIALCDYEDFDSYFKELDDLFKTGTNKPNTEISYSNGKRFNGPVDVFMDVFIDAYTPKSCRSGILMLNQ